MAQRPNISFIPKQSLAKENGHSARPLSTLMITGVGILLLIAGAYAGLFFYANNLVNQNLAREQQLSEVRSEIDQSILREAQRMEAQLEGAETLVTRHLALTAVFDFLESRTLPDVELTNLQFGRNEGSGEGQGNSNFSLTLQGRAPDFASVIELRTAFLETGGILSDGGFSNVSLGSFGEVNFTFNAIIDEGAIRYAPPSTALTPVEEDIVQSTTTATTTNPE